MKKFLINEWCPVRQHFVAWTGWFASLAEAYSYIEYFGSAEEVPCE